MGILSDLLSGNMQAIISLLYQLPAILIALTMHEVAHGYVAMKCGDPTAQMLGRLSLNPLHHLDPMGTVCMFLFGIGWAKPVPVNPRNYRHFKRDEILVSFAGIATNLCLFLLASVLMVIVQQFIFRPELFTMAPFLSDRKFLSFQEGYSFLLMQDHNLSLFAEMGLTAFLQNEWLLYIQRFLMYFAMVNLSLALFNLLPVPPLDGYHLFNDILFRGKLHIPAKVAQGISMVFMLVLAFTDVVSNLLSVALFFVQDKVIWFLLWIIGGL